MLLRKRQYDQEKHSQHISHKLISGIYKELLQLNNETGQCKNGQMILPHISQKDIQIVYKHMLTSSVIRGRQTKTTVRYYYASISTCKTKTRAHQELERRGATATLRHCWRECDIPSTQET